MHLRFIRFQLLVIAAILQWTHEGSVMQYEEDAYSRNGRPTLTAKDNSKLGNNEGFSQVKKVNHSFLANCIHLMVMYFLFLLI